MASSKMSGTTSEEVLKNTKRKIALDAVKAKTPRLGVRPSDPIYGKPYKYLAPSTGTDNGWTKNPYETAARISETVRKGKNLAGKGAAKKISKPAYDKSNLGKALKK